MRLLIQFAVRAGFVVIAALLLSEHAAAERRVAMVIGNASYDHAPTLRNPASDVALISTTLGQLGFEVTTATDLTRREIAAELSAFLNSTDGADTTLFYFAGHGIQHEGRNFLLGTDAKLETTFDIDAEGLDLEQVIDMLEQRSKSALVFVDACRNNPIADEFYTRNYSKTRASITRGLARLNRTFNGTMVTFSASPGQVAYDGVGDNSPFAIALSRHLKAENMEVLSAMKRVIRDVRADTENRQTPLVTNDLVTEIYLNPGDGDEAAAIAYREEERLYEAALAINTPRAWSVFFDRFPDGQFFAAANAARESAVALDLLSASGSKSTANDVELARSQGQRLDISRDALVEIEGDGALDRQTIRQAQAALNTRGYNVGPVDGVIGRGTRKGIADFQAAAGLPSTGALTQGTAAALGISVKTVESDELNFIASRNARKYDPLQLALFEDDSRLLRAAEALRSYEFIYGYHDDKLYIAVLTWCCPSWEEINRIAERAGGHLATIANPRENAFLVNLTRNDSRYWENHKDEWVSGPTIGLYQKPGSAEPAGGWVWVTGEPTDFINWDEDMPNNNRGTASIGAFGHPPRSAPWWRPNRAIGSWDDYNGVTRSFLIEIE